MTDVDPFEDQAGEIDQEPIPGLGDHPLEDQWEGVADADSEQE